MLSLIPPVILFLYFFKVSASFSTDFKSNNDPEAADARLAAVSSLLGKFKEKETVNCGFPTEQGGERR